MTDTKPTKKPSLVDPDFTGFWDSVQRGRENDWISFLRGFVAQLVFIGAWVFGGTFPVWILLLIFLRWYISLALLCGIMSYSFIFGLKPWPWAVRNLILAGVYFYEGGSSSNYEMPPEGYEKNHNNDPKKHQPAVLAIHPHGIFTQGIAMNGGIRYSAVKSETDKELWNFYLGKRADLNSDVFGPIGCNYCLCGDAIQYLPIFRDVLVGWTDFAALPSNKKFVQKRMSQGISMALVPGGFYEASFLEYGKEQVYIKKVKGFIKYALQYGYRIIPGYTFGECRTYRNLFNVNGSVKKFLSKNKLPAVLPVGCWWFPMLPIYQGVGIHTVYSYGKVLPKIDNPSQEDIDKWHEWYMNEIKGIFDRNKWRFGMDDEELLIW